MSKTKEELNKLKEEVEAVNEKLSELTPEEIAQITGGVSLHGGGIVVMAPYYEPDGDKTDAHIK